MQIAGDILKIRNGGLFAPKEYHLKEVTHTFMIYPLQ